MSHKRAHAHVGSKANLQGLLPKGTSELCSAPFKAAPFKQSSNAGQPKSSQMLYK